MASACVNNLPTTTYSSNWLNHPTISSVTSHEETIISSDNTNSDLLESSLNNNNAGDFNFQLTTNNNTMLPADELFSDGKLIPLQFSTLKPAPTPSQFPDAKMSPQKPSEKLAENSNLFSPKAPRCSSRLKELLGFKKTTTSCSSSTHHCKSIKQLLYKNNSKTTSSLSSSSSSGESSLSSPLLPSSSLSSSSDFCNDLPRLSLDSKKANNPPIKTLSSGPKLRPVRPKTTTPEAAAMMESPRMNPSGRVVFEGLERSSSCPSSFNGGIKCKHHYKGSSGIIERSYSANVNANATARITPVLNVPVCSIRGSSKFGFGQLFSSSSSTTNSQKKEGSSYGNNIKTHHHHYITSSKNKKEKHKENS